MQRLSILGLLVAVGAVLAMEFAVAAPLRTYSNKKFNYVINIPASWWPSVSTSGVAVLSNCSPKLVLPQGLMRDGCANVYIIPFQPDSIITPYHEFDEWIRANFDESHSNLVRRNITSWTNSNRSPQKIVQITADFERNPADDQRQSEINYYFLLDSRAFRIRALYWKDDSRTVYFETAVKELLRSIHTR